MCYEDIIEEVARIIYHRKAMVYRGEELCIQERERNVILEYKKILLSLGGEPVIIAIIPEILARCNQIKINVQLVNLVMSEVEKLWLVKQ